MFWVLFNIDLLSRDHGIHGKDITPFILQRVAELTEGASLESSILYLWLVIRKFFSNKHSCLTREIHQLQILYNCIHSDNTLLFWLMPKWSWREAGWRTLTVKSCQNCNHKTFPFVNCTTVVLKMMPPILCWPTTSDADISSMSVWSEPSYQ